MVMIDAEFEQAFLEVKKLITSKDKRSKDYKWQVELAKQEFLAEVEEYAGKWFDERVKIK